MGASLQTVPCLNEIWEFKKLKFGKAWVSTNETCFLDGSDIIGFSDRFETVNLHGGISIKSLRSCDMFAELEI